MKIISIDPGMVTGIMVVDYSIDAPPNVEPIQILNFDNFRLELTYAEQTKAAYRSKYMHQRLDVLMEFIEDTAPDLVIIENFIMFAIQVGRFGSSFSTSECIGVLEHRCIELGIPVVKPRSSDLRGKSPGKYPSGQPKPRKFKEGLTNKDLKARGLLIGRGNKGTWIKVGEQEFRVSDFKVGSKSDHMIMALRHIINTMELSKRPIEDRLAEIEEAKSYEFKEDNEDNA